MVLQPCLKSKVSFLQEWLGWGLLIVIFLSSPSNCYLTPLGNNGLACTFRRSFISLRQFSKVIIYDDSHNQNKLLVFFCFQPSDYIANTLQPLTKNCSPSLGTVACAPLVSKEHFLLLIRVFSPILLLKRGRGKRKPRTWGAKKKSCKRDLYVQTHQLSVYRLTIFRDRKAQA